tara:strand:+ start:645 stop:884 length:240 start_codon:yes stop_codon:yes gene_type:complete
MKQKNYSLIELKKVFKKELKIIVNDKHKINDFDKWDSLGNFNVLLACEKKFKFKFTNKEFNTLNTFKEILNIVDKRKKS